jgi:hypothetical protein
MVETIKTGAVLIKEGMLMPEAVNFESDSCTRGWRSVKNLDGYTLGRKIRAAGWTFFCIAGDIQATVFGSEGQKTVRRAVDRILETLKRKQFNSLEVVRVSSKRFLGMTFTTVSARSRHIQESMILVRPMNFEH